MQDLDIMQSQISDIEEMNRLSRDKRKDYEKEHNMFWRWAGESGEKIQREWFKELLVSDDYICLTAKQVDQVMGFIIGKIISAPEVYDPGGLTLLIDDFCVINNKWQTIGAALVMQMKLIAKPRGVEQLIVVSGHHDNDKKRFLKKMNLACASEWFVGNLI